MSESVYIKANFTQSFYGSKYANIRAIKHKYDPNIFSYAQRAVNSEDWKMSGMILGELPSKSRHPTRGVESRLVFVVDPGQHEGSTESAESVTSLTAHRTRVGDSLA
ncbi:hypothetical protein BKA65DRAFT_483199 [Rhexocercosporidium sp. MPI-PUGE-AT-0058]|nr:hypothetical protein BKA65DRAFT_483199 [Rhexocercosporidium sp. MPI-PUGE-AT-0058]